MNNIHEPDPRFLDKLEWQLTTDYRRHHRFSTPDRYSTKRRNLKMISVIVGSILTGVVATSTAAHFEAMSHRQLLLAKGEIRIQLADSKLKLMRQQFTDLKRKIEMGFVSEDDGTRMAGDIARLEIDKRRLELNKEEIQASSQPPQDDLSAPLLNGRDFVTERLLLDRQILQENEKQVQAELKKAQRRVEAGLITSRELEPIEMQLKLIHGEMDKLNRKIELRDQFRHEKLSVEQVDVLALVSDAEKQLGAAQSTVTYLREQLARLEKARQIGLITPVEVEQVRFQLQEAEADQHLAQLELQSLQLKLQK